MAAELLADKTLVENPAASHHISSILNIVTLTAIIQTMRVCNNEKVNKKHLKNVGPFATASRRTPIHEMSLPVLSRAACASMSTTTTTDNNDDDDNDNA